jgi:predicted permease
MPVLANASTGGDVRVQGFTAGRDTDMNARYNAVGPDFFQTMGMTLLAGRPFTASDDANAPRVAIVNEAFARKFNLDAEVVGTRMGNVGAVRAQAADSGDGLDTEIVGLVRDGKYSDVRQAPPPLLYRPFRQETPRGYMVFYVRTVLPPEQFLATIPRVVASLDPYLPVEALKTMPQQVRENIYLDRMVGMLSASFAGLATLLAAIGLYGVMAYTVGQRTREIGLRMALGADASRVRGLVLGQVARMTLVGGVAGVALGLAAGRAAQSVLYELEGHDPVVLVGTLVLLSGVAMVAGYLPARRAARIEPMRALRSE